MASTLLKHYLGRGLLSARPIPATLNMPADTLAIYYAVDSDVLSALVDGEWVDFANGGVSLTAPLLAGPFATVELGQAATAVGQTFLLDPGSGLIEIHKKGTGKIGEFPTGERTFILGNDGYYRGSGERVWIGASNVLNSYDSSFVISRELELDENAHDLAISTQILNMGGFAYAGLDNRGNVKAGGGNHLVTGLQGAWSWDSPGTLEDAYCIFDSLTVTDGLVRRNSGYRWSAPTLSGDGSVGQNIALNIGSMPEFTGPPSTATTNYAYQHPGSGRFDHNGQGRMKKLRIAHNDGSALEALMIEIDGATDGMTYIGQSGVWNWRTGMVKDNPDFHFKGNNAEALTIKAVTNHVLPGADGTQNFGAPDSQWNNSFFTVAPTVASDARLKLPRGPIGAVEAVWAAAIEPLAYQMRDAVAKKGADNARLHWGAIAQQIYEAGIASGIPDPLAYGFLGRDEVLAEVTKSRTVTRQIVEIVDMERPYIEIVDGVPIQKVKVVQEPIALVDHRQVVDEAGNMVLRDGAPILTEAKDGDGRIVIAPNGRPMMVQARDQAGNLLFEQVPLIVDVPRLETVTESYTELAVRVDEMGRPDLQWSIRYEELLMFLYAALRSRVAALEAR